MVLHIRSMEPNTFAKLIYEEQKTNQWPGLAKEVSVICQSLIIEDCNETHLDKQSYMKLVTAAIHRENERRLRLLAFGKCERILGEDYGKKSISPKKLYLAFGSSTEQGLVWKSLRAIIQTTEDLPARSGSVGAGRHERRSHT